jgi:hypothetical protein
MDRERIAQMTENVAADDKMMLPSENDDIALANVDQAMDNMIVAIDILKENLPKIKIENVPQKAAVDAVQDLLQTAVGPYTADMIKAMSIFGD